MSELQVKPVDFLGDTLMAAQDENGVIWAGVKWICQGIGLSVDQTKNERKKIQSDVVLSEGGSNLTLPTNGGKQEVLCLQLDFIPLWLAKITITPTMREENPELVEKLKRYQLKAKDVLAAAFLPGRKKTNTSAMETLRLHYAALEELDERTTAIEEKMETVIDRVDNQMTIDHGQQRTLQEAVAKRVYERAAIIYKPDEIKKNTRNLFPALYRDLKNRFGVPSYRDMKPKDYPAAMKYIEAWVEPADLREENQ